MSRYGLLACFRQDTATVKALKIYSPALERRVGITASSLKNAITKTCELFSISKSECQLVLEEDGTEVNDEDYFSVLPHHSVLVVLAPGQTWTNVQHRLEKTLSALQDANKLPHLQEAVHELMRTQHQPHILRLLGEIASSTQLNIHTETKREDPLWFKDLGASFTSKEQYMRENARRRVRGYFRTASDFIKKSRRLSVVKRRELLNLLAVFSNQLKDDDDFSDYFARSSPLTQVRLCDEDGWFRCEGPYDEEYCVHQQHRINPYAGWQHRVFFSTWNLDHCIEKTRQVLPSLVEAVKKKPADSTLNWLYFYELLFTRNNLKLVHIECHDKTEHFTAKCNPRYYYIN